MKIDMNVIHGELVYYFCVSKIHFVTRYVYVVYLDYHSEGILSNFEFY